MNLFLVRHGRTVDNEAGTVASLDSVLSELGVKQAESAAQRFKDVTLDALYSSDAERAITTARYIARHHSLPLTTTSLLREHKKPSTMLGLAHESPEAQRIYRLMDAQIHDATWHHSDEENYYDFRARLLKFLDGMKQAQEENILAVTHSLVIRLLTCLVVFGDDMSAAEFHAARWNMEAVNTGVTVLRFEERWKLVTFNDIAHLAE